VLTLSVWQTRFPQFASTSQPLFDIMKSDAVIEMGADELRWLGGTYDVAQANLIGHLFTVYQRQSLGDSSPVLQVHRKEVNDVVVEYANADLKSIKGDDQYLSTSYGQNYIRYRRMAFGGPRITG